MSTATFRLLATMARVHPSFGAFAPGHRLGWNVCVEAEEVVRIVLALHRGQPLVRVVSVGDLHVVGWLVGQEVRRGRG